MTEYCWNSQATSGMSNEDSAVLTFQRTISAQVVNIMLVLLFDSAFMHQFHICFHW